MSRTLQIAVREFVSTVSTKGFVIGTLVFPAIMIVAMTLIPKLINNDSPRYVGKILVIDQTGWTGAEERTLTSMLGAVWEPEYLAAEQEDLKEKQKKATNEALDETMGEGAGEALGEMGGDATDRAIDQQYGKLPKIEVVALAVDSDLELEKDKLREGTAFDGVELAVVLIDEHAVSPSDKKYGAYTLYIRSNLDDRFQNPLRQKLRKIIREARIEEAGMDSETFNSISIVNAGKPIEVTESGERESAGGVVNIFIAMGFMMLIWISVMTGGQYLMTTVITEKSNRVMEVLLSAVSPRQLMTGKIIGQMVVALTILGIYLTIGLVALDRFGFLDLIPISSLGLVIVYFFIAFFLIATMMAAIGSAVTEVIEAQSLLTPVMMVLIIPLLLMMPLTRNPNSTFATIMGFLPPISPFAMVLREAGSDPVPIWQHAVAIVIGVLSVMFAVWAAAKIFRIGVLMYGKPPNFRTLIKWVRMA